MTSWKTVKFGDVVRQVKDKVDPQESGLERYVAGEHMETDNLHIRSWGEIGDGYLGPAFHMRFKPGQVLYGSRRTYLRKVAVAEFEGITANTTYIIEPKDPEVLLPELLPFIMSTERFHEHSIQQSKGSVNPYINFSDIAWYEFPLPPIDEQRRIAELLWAADDVIEKLAALSESINATYKANAYKIFAELLEGNSPIVRLDEACSRSTQSGLYKNKKFYGSGVGMVHMGELFGNDFIDENVELQKVSLEEKEIETFKLTENDLLFGRRSLVLEGAGRCIYVKKMNEPVTFESSMIRVTLEKERANNQFLFEWFRSPQGDQSINSIRTFTTVAGVKGSDVAKLKIPLPDLEIQMEIVQQLSTIKEKIA